MTPGAEAHRRPDGTGAIDAASSRTGAVGMAPRAVGAALAHLQRRRRVPTCADRRIDSGRLARLGGVPSASPTAPSLVTLLAQGVIDAELAALVWLLV